MTPIPLLGRARDLNFLLGALLLGTSCIIVTKKRYTLYKYLLHSKHLAGCWGKVQKMVPALEEWRDPWSFGGVYR